MYDPIRLLNYKYEYNIIMDNSFKKPNETVKILIGHTSTVNSIAYSPDGRHIVSGSYDATIRIWDVLTQRQIGNPLTGHTNYVSSVVYSPDGRHIVSGSSDNTIRIWDNPVVVYRSYLKPYLITNLIGVVIRYV